MANLFPQSEKDFKYIKLFRIHDRTNTKPFFDNFEIYNFFFFISITLKYST